MSMPPIGAVSILISLIALWIAIKNYRRKHGIELRGSFRITSSITCEDKYVSNILIENIKDRSVTIFCIYLKVGNSIYVELANFDETPLILKPYETFNRPSGPIEFYSVNMRKVDINDLLSNHKIKKRLVLSTSEGRYIVPRQLRQWNPITEFFKNHYTGILHPYPSKYRDTHLGSNIRYVVEVTNNTGGMETIAIRRTDHEIQVFKRFRLTEECLVSAEALHEYLLQRKTDGMFAATEIKIIDIDKWRVENLHQYEGDRRKLEDTSFLLYHVLGRWWTYQRTRQLVRKNKVTAVRPRSPDDQVGLTDLALDRPAEGG